MSVEDVVRYESHSLKQYTRGSETEIIRKAGLVIKVDSVQSSQEYRSEQKETRLKNCKSKAMNGQHLRQTEENSAKESWQWMKRGSLKRETGISPLGRVFWREINEDFLKCFEPHWLLYRIECGSVYF